VTFDDWFKRFDPKTLYFTKVFLQEGYRQGQLEEREECAKIVEQYCGGWDDGGFNLAKRIRERNL